MKRETRHVSFNDKIDKSEIKGSLIQKSKQFWHSAFISEVSDSNLSQKLVIRVAL